MISALKLQANTWLSLEYYIMKNKFTFKDNNMGTDAG